MEVTQMAVVNQACYHGNEWQQCAKLYTFVDDVIMSKFSGYLPHVPLHCDNFAFFSIQLFTLRNNFKKGARTTMFV